MAALIWVKNGLFDKADEGNFDQSSGWRMYSAINFLMIRFADVLLWAAECEVEIGDINKAKDLCKQGSRKGS